MNGDVGQAKHSLNPTQTNASNIWQTMVKTVRDVDMQKVDDTKEDIDTLLVFAGLFSAVVTTFVVGTYPSLQPDNTDELVFLMRRSLAQNYTFADGVLRPMIPFPEDPPFEVPLWALRTNGLWFASLIVSLSTASFGMLVKQWLIEYVAMEQWISPQEQLRARQYRHPGLEDWRVFEIAAMLPLLLHISLGLFFLGLCFYTAAANETIGRSTFLLVAGWAFFALLTIIAPLASPRCPYKVTLFKAALRIGRQYVTSRFWKPIRGATEAVVEAARWTWWNIVCMPYRLYRAFMSGFAKLVDVTLDVSVILWLPVFVFFIPFLLLHLALSNLMRLARFIVSDPETDQEEEGDIMGQPYRTHELLLSVDEVIINDGPILETMGEVLKQTHTPPQFITAFVLGCIQHRIGTADRDVWISDIDSPVQGLLQLHTLSEGAWNLLLGLMGETLANNLPQKAAPISTTPGTQAVWMANAVSVLLSHSQWPIPESIFPTLTNPTSLAKMLQLVRGLILDWPTRDVLRIVWIAFMGPSKQPGLMSPVFIKDWGRLPSLKGRALSDLQVVVVQILLENAWSEGRDRDLALECYSEMVLMLAYILNTGPPRIDSSEHVLSLAPSSYNGQEVQDVDAAIGLLRPEYVEIASLLEACVGTSRTLIVNALNLYASFLSQSLAVSQDGGLWAVIYRITDDDLQSAGRRPVMHDLWRFLLKCARSATTGGGGHLQTQAFVKLCLALARAGVPRVFGRDDPARDWLELVPILEKTASEEVLTKHVPLSTAAEREYMISTLAHRALDDLQQAGDPDIPELLLRVLARLASKGPKPPPKQVVTPETREEGDGLLGTGIRLPFTRSGRARPPPVIVIDGPDHRSVSDARSRSRSPVPLIPPGVGAGRQRSRTVQLERGPSPTHSPVPDGLLHPVAHQSTLRTETPLTPSFVGSPPPSTAPQPLISVMAPGGQDSPLHGVQSLAPTSSSWHDSEGVPPPPRSDPKVSDNIIAHVPSNSDPLVVISASTQRALLDRPGPSEPHRPRNADRTIPQSPRPSLPSLRRTNTSRSTIVPGPPHPGTVDASRAPVLGS